MVKIASLDGFESGLERHLWVMGYQWLLAMMVKGNLPRHLECQLQGLWWGRAITFLSCFLGFPKASGRPLWESQRWAGGLMFCFSWAS